MSLEWRRVRWEVCHTPRPDASIRSRMSNLTRLLGAAFVAPVVKARGLRSVALRYITLPMARPDGHDQPAEGEQRHEYVRGGIVHLETEDRVPGTDPQRE